MNSLEPPDSHYLRAAEGWLDLGNCKEANEELKQIGLQERFHPQVMLVRWEIYSRIEHWEFAHAIAQGLVALAPEEPCGWIKRSICLHKMKRTPEAFHILLPAASKFPCNSTIAYDLACYACQLGRIEEARHWLDQALKSGDADKINLMAKAAADLKPLWEKTGKV